MLPGGLTSLRPPPPRLARLYYHSSEPFLLFDASLCECIPTNVTRALWTCVQVNEDNGWDYNA